MAGYSDSACIDENNKLALFLLPIVERRPQAHLLQVVGAEINVLGGDHTQHPSCGSKRDPAMRKEVARCILQAGYLQLLAQYLVARNAAVL